MPFLAKIQNPIILSHYTKEFSRKLEVTEESVEIAIRQFQKKQQTGMVLPIQKEAQSREMVLEEYLLSLVIQSENVQDSFRKVFSIISFDDFDTPSLKKIFETLAAFLSTHKKFSVRGFVENLPIELTPIFDKAYLKDIEKILGDEEKYKKELGTCAKEVKKLSLRRRVNSISTKIKKTEEEEGEETEALQKELQKVIRELREIDKDRK